MDLLILPCHSIWIPNDGDGTTLDEWHLASFQHEGKDWLCFREHILTSISYLKTNPTTTLIISGGATKKDAGPVSEAYSYYLLMEKLGGSEFEKIKNRVYLEEYARDSFDNVAFLVCRYYQIHDTCPRNISVVGFEFKRNRFTKHHMPALGITEVEYIGNTPYSDSSEYFEDLEKSEYQHAVRHFERDWFGMELPLADKRVQRNPFRRFHGYELIDGLDKFFKEGYSNEERREMFITWMSNKQRKEIS